MKVIDLLLEKQVLFSITRYDDVGGVEILIKGAGSEDTFSVDKKGRIIHEHYRIAGQPSQALRNLVKLDEFMQAIELGVEDCFEHSMVHYLSPVFDINRIDDYLEDGVYLEIFWNSVCLYDCNDKVIRRWRRV